MTRTDKAGSSLLGLISTVQRRHVTPAEELTHINNDPFAISSSVLSATCSPKEVLPQYVFRGASQDKVPRLVHQTAKNSVAGQDQPKHLNPWPVPCFENAAYRI